MPEKKYKKSDSSSEDSHEEKKKKYKTFKDYYNSDPEFRRRHLDYISERVPCECGFVTSRCNLSKHRRCRNHARRMGIQNNVPNLEYLKTIRDKLNKAIKAIEKSK
jgi:hypothetical protein